MAASGRYWVLFVGVWALRVGGRLEAYCGLQGAHTGPHSLGKGDGSTLIVNLVTESDPFNYQTRACLAPTETVTQGSEFRNHMTCIQFPDPHKVDYLPVAPSISPGGDYIAFARQKGTYGSVFCVGEVSRLVNNTNQGVVCSSYVYHPVNGAPSINGQYAVLSTTREVTPNDLVEAFFAHYSAMHEGTMDGIKRQPLTRHTGQNVQSFSYSYGPLSFVYRQLAGGQEICVAPNDDPNDFECGNLVNYPAWNSVGMSYARAGGEAALWTSDNQDSSGTKTQFCRHPVTSGGNWSPHTDNCTSSLIIRDRSGQPLSPHSYGMVGATSHDRATLVLSGRPLDGWSAVCWSDGVDNAPTSPTCHRFAHSLQPQGLVLSPSMNGTILAPLVNGSLCAVVPGFGFPSYVDCTRVLGKVGAGSVPALSQDGGTWVLGGWGHADTVCGGTIQPN